MPEHPCAEGLSSACFAAYPAWARQALAYKVLHVILPKQLTRRLPKGLGRALIGQGASLPPGLVFPPGMAIPPGFTWPESWNTWLFFYFEGDELPWLVFPEGWTPGDPLPPGVTIAPGAVIPSGWSPKDHPPAWLIPGYTPVKIPPGSGALAPLYVQPWEPGPVHGTPEGLGGIVLTADGSEHAGSVDGVWAAVRDTLEGASVDTGGELQTTFMRAGFTYGSYRIDRPIFRFSLSEVPLSAIIISGYLSLKLSEGVGITALGQTCPTVLWGDVQDYLSFSGDPGDQITLAAGENNLTLSDDSIAEVQSKIGSPVYIMARESLHEYANSPPAAGQEFRAIFYRHNADNPANRPSLVLYYK